MKHKLPLKLSVTIGRLKYIAKAAAGKNKTVSLQLSGITSKKVKQINVPAKINYAGKTYRVTEICDNAFAKNKSLTKIIVGKSVTKIGKKAFYQCKKLKKIVVKGENISFIGKNAFKGIHKKAVFKLPTKYNKKYKKKIKKAGFNL